MKTIKKLLAAYLLLSGLFFSGCSTDDDETDPDDPAKGGPVKITGTSPDYTFWGDELTITGEGFSSVKDENIVRFINPYPRTNEINYTSHNGDIEIISATNTQIKIRIPYAEVAGNKRGDDQTKIEVAVKENKDTTDHWVKFIGLPWVGNFRYHYGWYDLGGVARSGDSVILSGGFHGMTTGAGEFHPREAGVYDKLRLRVAGVTVPIKYRKITNGIHGWALYLPSADFSEVNCDNGPLGWGERPLDFEFYVLDTDKKNSKELSVTYLPPYSVTSVEGPVQWSKSVGGTPEWTVKGKDMYFTKARFVTTGWPVIEIGIGNLRNFDSQYAVGIPLIELQPNQEYQIYLVTPCDKFKHIGNIAIKP